MGPSPGRGPRRVSDPVPTLSLNPTAYDFQPPRVNQWNVGIQQKLPMHMVYDMAYIGSKSTDILRQPQINAVPIGATFLPQNQDPTRAASSTPGATALPNDFLRPYQGYGEHPDVGLRRLLQLQRASRRRSPGGSRRGTCSRCSTSGARR